VTHSQAAGSGEKVLRYLSRYVFKTATGNRGVPRLPDGRVRWNYRDSQTNRWQSLVLEPDELLRRFLQHLPAAPFLFASPLSDRRAAQAGVLPAGFHRVRRFGWLAPWDRP